MDISICSALLLRDACFIHRVPWGILDILRSGNNFQYLNTISRLALDPASTTIILSTHDPISVEICSRWISTADIDEFSAVTALARILPSAPHLSIYARQLLNRRRGVLGLLASQNVVALTELPLDSLQDLLLTLYRLLRFDNDAFASIVSPAQLQVLLQHKNLSVRYLTLRILCLYLRASEGSFLSMIQTHIGEGEIAGRWEDRTIDFAFFTLWEEKRLKESLKVFQECQKARDSESVKGQVCRRFIAVQEFSATVACFGATLVPRLDRNDIAPSSMIMTKTTSKNARSIAEGIKSSKPLLITGPPGVGKTSMIKDIARELGKDPTMVTLHLNEQTDAKLLIGMYISAESPGSFSWRPGILTTAVTEGRWVIIEDLDRAPKEIISTLLPLLERNELLVPHWGESIRAAPGFKLIATVRSSINTRENAQNPTIKMLGLRQWLHVPFDPLPDDELAEVVIQKFPLLHVYVPLFMQVYRAFKQYASSDALMPIRNSYVMRVIGPQDLIKWSRRVQDLLSSAGVTSCSEPISDIINEHIFLEAVDCFFGAYPDGPQRTDGIHVIGECLHMPAERLRYCLNVRKPGFSISDSAVHVGRFLLGKRKKATGVDSASELRINPFATTYHVSRLLESVAGPVKQAEPCLLVGETGCGKTTIVQRLAAAMGRKLTVVNLSQQSEAGDLLGGYKPTNIRALAIPMKEEFDELLALTFTSKKNQFYIETLGDLVSKGRWAKVLILWQDALRMIYSRLKPLSPDAHVATPEPNSKRRRLQSPKLQKLKGRWEKFAADVQVFQKHLGSGSKGFAFSFVEGNIVKAARNGDWVLLDEINLASPDTLESIADLFSPNTNGGASVLLTESGDTERIHAHEDFRVFGAMNPATDIGKRDLPMSLRSRFTELFIEAPDKDLENLESVINAYLDPHHHLDVRAATDIALLYLDIQKLASENRLVDGAKQRPHFSLRTLTRTLIYILDVAPVYGLRRAIFEGFLMSFLTTLDRESGLLIRPLIEKHILGEQKNSKAILHQIPRLAQDRRKYVRFKHYWIAQGNSPIEEQAHYIITPFIEQNLLSLVRATSTRRFPILLQGPTSSGKTSMIEYLARLSGNKFIRINNHEHTDLQEYLGTYVSSPNGGLEYQEGVLVRALQEGYWIVLDELNLAPTDVLEALNRLLDDNRELFLPETQRVVKPHENFVLFATQNPPGMYGGRKVLSRAFRNRFLELHFDDIPETELETILCERSQIAPSFCTRIVNVYKRLSILRHRERLFEQNNSFATLRDLFRWASRSADDREQLAVNGFFLLAERVRNNEERMAVKSVIEEVMKVKIDERFQYEFAKIQSRFGHHLVPSSEIVWTKSMCRLCVLISEALKNHEPVLLVGGTGSGKTTICQVTAKMTNTKLHILNAHQNMETSDLIGVQRPIRNKCYAELQLRRELINVLKDYDAYDEDHMDSVSELLRAYENLPNGATSRISEQRRLAIEDSRIKAKSLFEWADGSLVTAMRNGCHFLLDEISLADDSVLERLNSILEPGRTLFLAEKGTTDDCLQAAPGFQFLATMNPGGDYGKRELSPALRNRFTEIWVPNISLEEEILEVVQTKLAPQLSTFAKAMVTFAAWFSATYQVAAPHISIRALLSWVTFMNRFQDRDPGVGLMHGAAMVYIDSLSANPAAKLSIDENEVTTVRSACMSKLIELFALDLSSIYSVDYSLRSDCDVLGVGPFSLAKAPGLGQEPRYSLQAPTTTFNALKIIRALQLQKPILIEGSPGVGKTTLVTALAHAIGMPLTRINLSDQTDLMDLFGSDVPVEGEGAGYFHWIDAPFLRAMQKGEWVLLDEMNLASQGVLEGLNACLDHRGQVYISELDRVFERHPNFVVIAAQNPHHQGGGRKGLPASFVDRFTIVYADALQQEDLMFISNELFPRVPQEHREKVVHSTTAIIRMLEENRGSGLHGGPWEINLRDVLRWLHLLGSPSGFSSFANPAQYQDLILLQRFRTSDDVAVASDILQPHLAADQSLGLFYGKCASLLEIGLAFLPRGPILQPILNNTANVANTNLEIGESAMLCIQHRWPCLLVGASGSGKSNLIFQLAISVGADILEIPLNSEMDTTDLIGGYEQVDPQRRFASFLKKVQEYARRVMVSALDSKSPVVEYIMGLETQLRNQDLDPIKGMQGIQEILKADRSPEVAYMLEECEDLLRQSRIDCRARFEWVDGILVRGLREGKWVILDNANLCNPSVLDRLNSLLEPNGCLNINEHRDPDGSAQVVHPHENFRLFMTMDPAHGELSRAMRNRSVELFMSAQHQSPSIEVLGSSCESPISRFQLFQAFEWNNLDDNRFKCLLIVFFDHLAPSDFQICDRWEAQIRNGLMCMSSEKQSILSLIIKAYKSMLHHGRSMLRGICEIHEKFEEEVGALGSGFVSMQVSLERSEFKNCLLMIFCLLSDNTSIQ